MDIRNNVFAMLIKTYGPRGTLHLLPADEVPLWTAALRALPLGHPGHWFEDSNLTPAQAQALFDTICGVLNRRALTRSIGRLWRECLDQVWVCAVRQWVRSRSESGSYFNRARPQQAIAQRIPADIRLSVGVPKRGKLIASPILNGLHHDYPVMACVA